MNKREAIRQHEQANMLQSLGFTADEANALRRISNTLRRWYELECGTERGCISRDDVTGKPYWQNSYPNAGAYPCNMPDREKGAIKRLDKIMARVNVAREIERAGTDERGTACHLAYYLQTDPRGACLYIMRPGDVPVGADVSADYTRGLCVY